MSPRRKLPHPPPTVIVIGAGVLGLSTANLLQQRYPDHQITIIASEFLGDQSPSPDYASAWAGAHYRPIPGNSPQLKDEAELAKRTFGVMKRIAAERPEAGVGLCKGVEYLEQPTEVEFALKDGDEVAGKGDGFRVLRAHELPRGVKWGCEYATYCINVPVYCGWLFGNFKTKAGKVLRCNLQSAKDAFAVAEKEGWSRVEMVVNCSGRNFDSDPAMKIIRGQTVLVKQQYDKTVTRQRNDGSWAFLIPRPRGGGTIVGGTKEIGDWEEIARAATRENLLQAAVEAFPDFVKKVQDFEVMRDNVGRRPFREGGLRLEQEALEEGKNIIHAYGTGGRGYETSWGIAERVIDLFTEVSNAGSEPAVPATAAKL